MRDRIRVLLVDDHEIARLGLRRILETEPDLRVVGEASTAEEAFQQAATLTPDVVLMDIRIPETTGLEVTRELHRKGFPGKVIMLSMYGEYLSEAIRAGAQDTWSRM